MSEAIPTAAGEYLGAGRSATVFRIRDRYHQEIAQKVFTSESVSRLILFILTGSANPYTWCGDAMASAIARREILGPLLAYWFDGKVRPPKIHGWGWNEEFKAYELRSELIRGTHAPLLSPADPEPIDYFDDLYNEVMRPLQRHLRKAGLDGLVWQAGLGNPVAANNFMLEQDASPAMPSWVWIDLESGVPALFAMNPLQTLGFYLPRSWHHGRWLFDDVDLPALRAYVGRHRREMTGRLGEQAVTELDRAITRLDFHQSRWRRLGRTERSLRYALSQGKISEEQAGYYRQHPLLWQLTLASRGAVKLVQKLSRLPAAIASRIARIPFRRLLHRGWRYTASSRYRRGVARWFVARRIKSWTKRRYLTNEEAFQLRHRLHHDDSSAYLTDFSVHIAIKPLADIFSWGLFPALWALGVIPQALLPVLIIAIGPLLRVSYTSARIVQEIGRRQKPQWVALGVGALPAFGNLAYPVQLLYRSVENSGELARFIIYDLCAGMGRKVPVWGGHDSQTEHVMNRFSDSLVRRLNRLIERKAQLRTAQRHHH